MNISYRTPAQQQWVESISQGNPDKLFRNIITAIGNYFGTIFPTSHIRCRIIPRQDKCPWGISVKWSALIFIATDDEFIPTTIHELLHIFCPDWNEEKVEQTARAIFTRNAYSFGLRMYLY